MKLGVKTIIGYDKGILEAATSTTPMYPTGIGHTQSVLVVQGLQGEMSPVCTFHAFQTGGALGEMSGNRRGPIPATPILI